jgi:hypothetical protein
MAERSSSAPQGDCSTGTSARVSTPNTRILRWHQGVSAEPASPMQSLRFSTAGSSLLLSSPLTPNRCASSEATHGGIHVAWSPQRVMTFLAERRSWKPFVTAHRGHDQAQTTTLPPQALTCVSLPPRFSHRSVPHPAQPHHFSGSVSDVASEIRRTLRVDTESPCSAQVVVG